MQVVIRNADLAPTDCLSVRQVRAAVAAIRGNPG